MTDKKEKLERKETKQINELNLEECYRYYGEFMLDVEQKQNILLQIKQRLVELNQIPMENIK